MRFDLVSYFFLKLSKIDISEISNFLAPAFEGEELSPGG